MIVRRTLVVALAAAIAIAFSPLAELRAAPLAGPASQSGAGDLVQLVQAKKKASKKKAGKKKKKGKRKGKKAAKSGKSCGTFMYRKGGKCVDARNKK